MGRHNLPACLASIYLMLNHYETKSTAGFFEIKNDEIIFVRASIAPSSGEKDVAVLWKTGRCGQSSIVLHQTFISEPRSDLCTADMKQAITECRDRCIGPPDEVSRSMPQNSRAGYTGGIAFERNNLAKPVKKGTRCYTIGNSAEGPTLLMAPNKGAKVMASEDDESLEMRRSLGLVCLFRLLEQVNS